MAISHMGDRHPNTFPPGDKADEVSHRGHRVLYQVGGSRTSRTHHRTESRALCLEEHRLPLWNTQEVGLRQWHPVHESSAEEDV